jgi:hypothetical protein
MPLAYSTGIRMGRLGLSWKTNCDFFVSFEGKKVDFLTVEKPILPVCESTWGLTCRLRISASCERSMKKSVSHVWVMVLLNCPSYSLDSTF